jgi:hypothetical protein
MQNGTKLLMQRLVQPVNNIRNSSMRRLVSNTGLTLLISLFIFALAACQSGKDSATNEQTDNDNNTISTDEESAQNTVNDHAQTDASDQEQAVLRTRDINADSNFNFLIEEVITLKTTMTSDTPGAIHVYADQEILDDLLLPDPRSRIVSFNPHDNPLFDVTVLNTQQALILHWVPMTAEDLEQFHRIDLSQALSTYSLEL